jgi:hypothetical protein
VHQAMHTALSLQVLVFCLADLILLPMYLCTFLVSSFLARASLPVQACSPHP